VLERAISVIEDTNAVPQLGLLDMKLVSSPEDSSSEAHLWIAQVIERLLVGGIGLLKIVHHEVAVALTVVSSGLASISQATYRDCPRRRHCFHQPLRYSVNILPPLGSSPGSVIYN
jgi:hypothetical protein